MATSEPLDVNLDKPVVQDVNEQDCEMNNTDSNIAQISNVQDSDPNDGTSIDDDNTNANVSIDNTNTVNAKINSVDDTQTCCFKYCSTTPTKVFTFTAVDFLLLVFSLVTYIADIASDFWVAFLHYQNGDVWWMSWTLTFIIGPCVVTALWRLIMYDHSCKEIIKNVVPVAIPGGFMCYFISDIHDGLKILRERNAEKRKKMSSKMIQDLFKSSFFRLFEGFVEAAPQLVLQLYIMFNSHTKHGSLMEAVQWGSVCISLASLSWAMTSYYKIHRLDRGKYKVSLPGVLLVLASHVFTVAARVLSLALFAVFCGYALLLLCGIHYVIMLIWTMLMFNSNLCRMDCEDYGDSVVFAVVAIFCFRDPDHKGPLRLKYAFFYTVVYIENVGMLLAWYFTTQPLYDWHRYLACVVIIGGYFIGILCLVVYYIDLHPKNFLKNPKYHIKVCVPCSKLKLIEEREKCRGGCIFCSG